MFNDEKDAINEAQFVCYHLTLQNMPELIRSKSQVCDLRYHWSMKFTTKISYSFEMKELYYLTWPILPLTATENYSLTSSGLIAFSEPFQLC